jgi:hypothetical protein
MATFLLKAMLLAQTTILMIALQYIYTVQHTNAGYSVMISTAPVMQIDSLAGSSCRQETFTRELVVSALTFTRELVVSALPSKPEQSTVSSVDQEAILEMMWRCAPLLILAHVASIVYIKLSEMEKARIERRNRRLIDEMRHLTKSNNGRLLLGTSKSSVQLCSSRRFKDAAYVLNRNGDQYVAASG